MANNITSIAMIVIAIALTIVGAFTIFAFYFTDDIEMVTALQAIVWIAAGVVLFMAAHHIRGG